MRGGTEDECREQLRRHLNNSQLHRDLHHAYNPQDIERIVQSTEVRCWNPSGYRERSRSRDSSPPRAQPSQGPPPPTPMDMPDPDDVVQIPADELIQISVTLEVAALRLRSLVDDSPQSFDV